MQSMADASPELLRTLARNIESSGKWVSFLTPQEHQLFRIALEHSLETWTRFLKGTIPTQLRISGSDEDEDMVIIDMDSVTLAFRVRYMLWESQIDTIFDKSHPSILTADVPDPLPVASQSASKAGNEDEDYDFDMEDEQAEPEQALELLIIDTKHEDSEPDASAKPAVIHNSLRMYDTFDTDVDQIKRYQRLKESDEQIQEIEDLTEDVPNNSNESETKTSQGSEKLELKTEQRTSVTGLAAFAKSAQFGSANLCLKHLLTTIETKRGEMHVTDIELRNLISDVRKNRSKWANEDRIGQEELYEACERVVQELRGYTEHSTAFLNKVNKREAPNYYEVIKTPMDLNSVMRKIRAFQYNSKTEFVNDVNLIWSNCLTYNSDPAHYLRKHAIAMRQRTQALVPLIPDIVVRSRAEVEAEAEEEERQAREQLKRRLSDSDGGKRSQKRSRGKAPAESLEKNDQEENDQEEKEPSDEQEIPKEEEENNEEQDDQNENDNTESVDVKIENNNDTNENEHEDERRDDNKVESTEEAVIQTESELIVEEKAEVIGSGVKEEINEDISQNESDPEPFGVDEDYKTPDVETMVWNTVTRKRRLECITNRQQLFIENKLQMNATIFPRTPSLMLRFEKSIRGEDIANQLTGMSLLSSDDSNDPFMIEYEVNSGIPPTPSGDNAAWLHAPVPKLSELPSSGYIPNGTLNSLILRNLNEMQMIRRLCAKILFIRDLQGGQMTIDFGINGALMAAGNSGGGIGGGISVGGGASSAGIANSGPGSGSDFPDIKDCDEDISSRMPGATHFSRQAAFGGMKRAVSKLAMASGFEAAQPSAVNCLAEIAGDYLGKLAQVLVSNLEAPNSTASFGAILKGSMEAMGVDKLQQLTNYISDDVLRQGRRLSGFRNRLNTSLIDILRPEVEKYQDEQFQDNSEQFVLGQFSNELGDDYFGFKELGIDKELGVSSVAIPFHLLQQRIADSRAGISRNGKIRELDLTVPEYGALKVEDLDSMPSFLQPRFKKLFGDPITDEQLQQAAQTALAARAKVPASGKLLIRKKKFDKAFILPEPAPEPKPEPLEPEPVEPKNFKEPVASPQNPQAPEAPEAPEEHEQVEKTEPNDDLDDSLFEDNAPMFTFDDSLPTGSLLLHDDPLM